MSLDLHVSFLTEAKGASLKCVRRMRTNDITIYYFFKLLSHAPSFQLPLNIINNNKYNNNNN